MRRAPMRWTKTHTKGALVAGGAAVGLYLLLESQRRKQVERARVLQARGPVPRLGQFCEGQPSDPTWPLISLVSTALDGERTPFSHLTQGVTHDASNWYFSQQDRLARVPATDNLRAPAGAAYSKRLRDGLLPKELSYIDHLGDMEYRDGKLYVAAEPTPCKVLVFDAATLAFIAAIPAKEQNDMPWVAVRGDGTLFTSEFHADRIFVRSPDGTLVKVLPLTCASGASTKIMRVQGGTMSPDGKLWLASDASPGGIYGVDSNTGRVCAFMPTPRREKILGFQHEELEGITYWDLGRAGQLHLTLAHAFHMPWLDDGLSMRSYVLTTPPPLVA